MWDWLLSLDKGKGGLLQYFPRIQMEFDCEFAQIAASRLPQPVSDGVLGMVQPQLFEAATPLVSLLLLLKERRMGRAHIQACPEARAKAVIPFVSSLDSRRHQAGSYFSQFTIRAHRQ
ncbi:unnamed protein product [Prorocentrum cordatum]|uniref:Uncharacterized protein n=1 Tax=Prorocentrum cordatum TaxID=2364126 RepID=A0ABN9QV34_9DINO|nr:unnamed protein product [Polarella glacialis]